MSLLDWDQPIHILAGRLSAGPLQIILGDCRLRMPSRDNLQGIVLHCSAVVALDSKTGFDVEIQGAMTPESSAHLLAAALQVKTDTPFRLRGVDAEGAAWYIGDVRLQVHVDVSTQSYRAKLSPNWISVRSPTRAANDNHELEIAVDSGVKLPALDYNLDSDAWETRQPPQDAGRIQSEHLDIIHAVAGDYRIVSVATQARATARSLRNLLDAFAFANGRRVDPDLTRVSSPAGRSLHIHRKRPWTHTAIPPIRWAGTNGMRRVWRALHAFWLFAQAEPEPERPKLCQALAELHGAASPTYISAKALIAAVAVEGLVNHYIRGQGAKTKVEVEAFKAVIRRSDLPDDARDQCLSALGYMTRANAAGRLRALAAAGVIQAEHSQEWIRNRPRLAHGVKRDGEEDPSTFLHSMVICHAIVLGLIGVEDEYEARVPGRIDLFQSRSVPDDLREVGARHPSAASAREDE